MLSFLKGLTYLICNLTGATNLIARLTGVRFFLPQLFLLRYANFAGVSAENVEKKLSRCRSFEEKYWCDYWGTFADEHELNAQKSLEANDLDNAWKERKKAIAFNSAAAFPGTTPLRLARHAKAKVLFEKMLPLWNNRWEKVELTIGQDNITGYLFIPDKSEKFPVMLTTNGLEGTSPEIVAPMVDLNIDQRKLAIFVMEMPGTYEYKTPLSLESHKVYSGVIDYLADHENIDEDKISMLGLSFGAHWSARMPAVDNRIKASVVNGAPLLFDKAGARPEVIIKAMKKVLGAHSFIGLVKALKSLSFNHNNGEIFNKINIPMMVINGDKDTLIPTSDSVVLAEKVKGAELKLYENDDHCAIAHYDEMIVFSVNWIQKQFNNNQSLSAK
jgi:esterase FrsA